MSGGVAPTTSSQAPVQTPPHRTSARAAIDERTTPVCARTLRERLLRMYRPGRELERPKD